MSKLTDTELFARFAELIGDDDSSDDALGAVIVELELRGL